MPPARSSHVHRNEIDANVTNAASGSAEQERRRRRALAPAGCDTRARATAAAIDEVEREQQERLLVAELDREAERRDGEEHDRNGCRVAGERNCDARRPQRRPTTKREPRRVVEEELDVVVADERPAEPAGGEPEEREPDEREDPAARDERKDGAERSDERGDLRELDVLHDEETLRHE